MADAVLRETCERVRSLARPLDSSSSTAVCQQQTAARLRTRPIAGAGAKEHASLSHVCLGRR